MLILEDKGLILDHVAGYPERGLRDKASLYVILKSSFAIFPIRRYTSEVDLMSLNKLRNRHSYFIFFLF
jgi:hypothetical protein